MSSYFDVLSWTRARKNREALEKTNPQNPVLNEEDENFLQKIASQEAPAPPLPVLEPTVIADDGTEEEASRVQKEAAEMILPTSPAAVDEKMEVEGGKGTEEGKEKRTWASYIPSIPAIPSLKSKKADADGDKNAKVEEKEQEKDAGKSVESEAKPEATGDAKEDTVAESDKVEAEKREEEEEKKIEVSEESSRESTDATNETLTEEATETSTTEPEKEAETITEEPVKETEGSAESKTQEVKEAKESPAQHSSETGDDAKPEPEVKTSDAVTEEKSGEEPKTESGNDKETEKTTESTQRTWASYIPAMPSLGRGTKGKEAVKDGEVDPASVAAEAQSEETREKDEREVSVLLDRLNLSAINNRVFSFSDQSQKIYQEFTLILKDMVNGGPTAYHDMENLIKNNEHHLDEMFSNMPPFVQTLVKSLPAKFASSMGPEIMAAASDKPGADLKARMEAASRPGSSSASALSNLDLSSKKKQKRKVPGVKALSQEKGAVASMLSNILNFLKVRFPAFVTGTNVLMSLAVFILLFVFWYCHKRGKEVRLLKESESAKASAVASEASDSESESENEKEKPEVEEEPSAEVVADVEKRLNEGQNEAITDSQDQETVEAQKDETRETQDEAAGVKKLDVSGPDNEAANKAKKILEQPPPVEVPLPEKE